MLYFSASRQMKCTDSCRQVFGGTEVNTQRGKMSTQIGNRIDRKPLNQAPGDQVRQLNWVKKELVQLQQIYHQTLRVSPDLKKIILDFGKLMEHLFALIKLTLLLAEQVNAYYFESEKFSFEKMLNLLKKVKEAQQTIINHIIYLIEYYNTLAMQASSISKSSNALIPQDAYLYIKPLKRYLDTELRKTKQELKELRYINSDIIQSLAHISQNSQYANKKIYLEIQRVISRVVKCYIALASQTNVNVDKTIRQTNEIIQKEDIGDPYQELCSLWKVELKALVSNMEWAFNILNRFLLPKVLEYLPKEGLRFLNFFDNNEKLLGGFTKFVQEVFEKTSTLNPCRAQTDVVYRKKRVNGIWEDQQEIRTREIMLIISDQLPMDHSFSFHRKNIKLKKGQEFIIKFGVTYFDQHKSIQHRADSKPVGYVQVFLQDSILGSFDDPEAHELYVGDQVFISLNEQQTNSWRDVILLSLIAAGMKYDVKPSEYLRQYLVKILKN